MVRSSRNRGRAHLVVADSLLTTTAAADFQERPRSSDARGFVRDASGRPVTDLQPSDFTVTVDGQPRRVLNARLYGSGAEEVIRAGTPVPRFAKSTDAVPGRAVVFAVDRDSIRSGTEKPILDTAASIIATSRRQMPSASSVCQLAASEAERKLVAEFALSRSNDATGWVGYRNVVEVDRKTVSDQRDRRLAISAKARPTSRRRRAFLMRARARTSGRRGENFNEHGSALLVPGTAEEISHSIKGRTKIDGMQVLEIGCRKAESRTIIRTSEGRDVACRGTLWVVPQDGTAVQTECSWAATPARTAAQPSIQGSRKCAARTLRCRRRWRGHK